MANRLTSVLAKLFRDRARSTSLRELRQEGHRSVRVLDLGLLEEMLTGALETALTDSSIDPATAALLNEQAGSELARMLGQKNGLERTNHQLQRQQSALEENVRQVQGALENARSDLDEAGNNGSENGLTSREKLRTAWDQPLSATREQWAGDHSAQEAIEQLHRSLEDATVALLSSLRPSAPTDDETDVAVLQRRVQKLRAKLDDAHGMMARLENRHETEKSGIASVHATVQGLRGDEENFTHRKELLREVFQLNLELRDDIAGKDD